MPALVSLGGGFFFGSCKKYLRSLSMLTKRALSFFLVEDAGNDVGGGLADKSVDVLDLLGRNV